MSIFDENNLIEITQDDIQDASSSSSSVEERYSKRAFANVLGARLGIKFLKSIGINASNFESLYTIPAVLKDMDISDICINNVKVDVRIVVDELHLCIPKAHYTYEVTPDIYIFMKLSSDFSTAEFIGAIAPDEVNKSVESNDYYFISNSGLYNENSLKKALSKKKPQSNVKVSDNDVIKAESLIVNFIDGDIMNNEKHFIYNILKESNQLRSMFKEFEHFELVSTDLAHTEEILSDSVLDVIGAQQIYNEDMSDGEFASDVDLDELANSTVADFVEDFIDENKEDEIMLDDNNEIIEGEFQELLEDTPIEEAGTLEELPSDEELASFETTNNLEDLSLDYETADFELLDDSLEEIQDIQTGGFEDFEGIDTNSNEASFEDLIGDSTEDLSLDDIDVSNVDFDLANDNISLDDVNTPVQEEDSILSDSDFSNLDNVQQIDELPQLEEMQPLEDLTPIDDSSNFEEVEDVQETPVDYTFEQVDEQPMSLLETVQNEGMELTPEEGLESLEAFEQPIDLTLPTLEPDADLPSISDDVEEVTLDEAQVEQTQTLDNIAQDFNFDNLDVDSLELPENIETLEQIEELTQTNDAEEIDLSDFDMNSPAPTEENLQPDEGFGPVEPLTEQVAETPAEKEQSEDEDFSGLEEFTMDMAAQVELENPDLLKPQGPMEKYDAMSGFAPSADNTFNPSQGFTAAPDYDESQGFKAAPDYEEPSENTQSDSEDLESAFVGFESAEDNGVSETTQNSEMDNINLDDLDDFDDDSSSIQATDDELLGDDFNIDELNIDDIDLNDPNLNIENIDIDLNDIEDYNNVSSLDNIPDMSNENQGNNMQYNEQAQADYQNQYMQEQMGISGQPQQDYVPDFNANDQGTIETLYEGNQQNQMPGEAMNQSFDQNNVNSQPMPPNKQKPKKQKTSPLLGILLIVLVCAFAYTKKDMIIEKINMNKGVTVTQDQNMPIEGETQEEKQDAELLNEAPANNENPEDIKQGIGAIPGEAGGPQDIASMNASLNQKGSMAAGMSGSFSKTPEPLATRTIKRIYWEVPQELTYNDAIVNFLKTSGKTIKFSSQTEMLNATESPYSTKMIINLTIRKDGSFDNVGTAVSSGSKQIDAIVLQSVKAALKYVKAPTAEFKNDSYDFSLIINF